MPIKQANTPYPLIDSDPHAARVVRYMRPSDYAVWAGGAAAAPALLLGWGESPFSFEGGVMEVSGGTEEKAEWRSEWWKGGTHRGLHARSKMRSNGIRSGRRAGGRGPERIA